MDKDEHDQKWLEFMNAADIEKNEDKYFIDDMNEYEQANEQKK